ncbi:anhydro-N-acetylmuramic acid kinase [Saccharopolyspora rhizosphaerae]|uniref:Anhydro-N-acetylmuramic acid kinase n=1 Tax=Saccharopolyspora rhizosphaerae TaxID=2492662 RepID=A0A3R8NYY0_9PSEU|nr:anhydro-N-acetylmuramic acid kinase [Saccharopolyspora rhizosphaerae]RRO16231.1 anhydro-N-acetylmuramic acid kinase [Saccharopolyspora rhizosphaerae]
MRWWRVVGLLSGTSMDGIDVAVADLRLDGESIELRPLGEETCHYPTDLREELRLALPPGDLDAEALCRLDTRVGQAFADAARTGAELAGGSADFVASLGQTLFHWVDGGQARGTLQIGQPAWIAEATGLPVISDLRARDVAAAGHGAPLAGVLDALWLAGDDSQGTQVALNIGGIANITVVGGSRPLAYDTGPGNALIDLAAQQRTGRPQDTDGALAATGTVHGDLLKLLLADEYYRLPAPKSTGKEHFGSAYLTRVLQELGEPVSDGDLLATLTELTARTIADACRAEGAGRVVVAGGGVHNPVLLTALRRSLDVPVLVSDELGMPADSKEALLTALLGFLTWHGLPGNTPGTTGAVGPRILGSITPGATGLRLPEPATTQPRRLIMRSAATN